MSLIMCFSGGYQPTYVPIYLGRACNMHGLRQVSINMGDNASGMLTTLAREDDLCSHLTFAFLFDLQPEVLHMDCTYTILCIMMCSQQSILARYAPS